MNRQSKSDSEMEMIDRLIKNATAKNVNIEVALTIAKKHRNTRLISFLERLQLNLNGATKNGK